MDQIASIDLRPADLPGEQASLQDLISFAHSFNGYAHWGSLERCAEIANAKDHSSLDSLRTCLFFEARRWRHYGRDPDPEAEQYWRLLVSKIRHRLRDNEVRHELKP